jgi:hypothetical protein
MMIRYFVLRLFFGTGLLWHLIMPERRLIRAAAGFTGRQPILHRPYPAAFAAPANAGLTNRGREDQGPSRAPPTQ